MAFFLRANNFVLFSTIVHPSSAIWPRDMSDELFSPGMIDVFCALDDKRGDKGILPSSLLLSDELFGKVTFGPSKGLILLSTFYQFHANSDSMLRCPP